MEFEPNSTGKRCVCLVTMQSFSEGVWTPETRDKAVFDPAYTQVFTVFKFIVHLEHQQKSEYPQ